MELNSLKNLIHLSSQPQLLLKEDGSILFINQSAEKILKYNLFKDAEKSIHVLGKDVSFLEECSAKNPTFPFRLINLEGKETRELFECIKISAEKIYYLISLSYSYTIELENVFDAVPYDLLTLEKDGTIRMMNKTDAMNPGIANRLKITDYITEDQKIKVNSYLTTIFSDLKPIHYFAKGANRTQPGQLDWYENKIYPIIKNDSAETAVLIYENIAHKKDAEFTLMEKEAQLSAIINNTTDIILSIDKDLKIVEFNSVMAHWYKLGYKKDLKPGIPVLDTINPKLHEDLRNLYERVFNGEPHSAVEMFEISGKKTYFESFYNPIRTNGNITGIAIFSRDITQKIETESHLRKALKEKEVLLAEVHHRVKNNLAIISGILQLQSSVMNNPEAISILNDCVQRIKTTAIVHEKLYENNSLAYINLKNYLESLGTELSSSYKQTNKEINLNVNCDSFEIDLKRAVPCGLIINELVTNCYKHAFKKMECGRIEITGEKTDKGLLLSVRDNGIGADPTSIINSSSTGYMLINTFSEQLGATMNYSNHNGLTVNLIFDL